MDFEKTKDRTNYSHIRFTQIMWLGNSQEHPGTPLAPCTSPRGIWASATLLGGILQVGGICLEGDTYQVPGAEFQQMVNPGEAFNDPFKRSFEIVFFCICWILLIYKRG